MNFVRAESSVSFYRSLDDGHTYGLGGDQESDGEESGDEEGGDEDVENVGDSDKETGEVSDGEQNENGDDGSDQENGKYGYILDAADDSMWSVTLPEYLEKQDEEADADDSVSMAFRNSKWNVSFGVQRIL